MKLLPLLLLLTLGAFAQTATYTTSLSPGVGCQDRNFNAGGGNCNVGNVDGSHTWLVWGGSEGWVDFYEGTCVGTQYTTATFTASTFDVTCDNKVTKTEIKGTFVKTHMCRYGICFFALQGTSSITATPEVLHSLGVPGY